MRKHGEKWIIDVEGVQHLIMAVGGRKTYDGSLCHGCSFVDKWDDDCTLKKVPCDMGCRIKDLGILNGAGFLPEERTGKYPAVDKNLEHGFWFATYNDKNLNVHCTGGTLQELIDNWNRRT